MHSGLLIRQFEAAPRGKLFSLHGDRSVFGLSLQVTANALLQGSTIALVDGANRFDAYALAEFARRVTAHGYAWISPGQFLEKIFVARAFTCYQMEATITERLPAFLTRTHSSIAVIFGVLDTFYDEQAPLFEARSGVERVIHALHMLKREGISVLLASEHLKAASKERSVLSQRLFSAMDRTFSVPTDGRNQTGRYASTPIPISQEGSHGTYSTDIHTGCTGRNGNLEKVPPGIARRRSGRTG